MVAGVDGIEGARHLRESWPWIRVVAFSGDADDALVARATDAGVDIFASKESPLTDMVDAIRIAARG